MSTATHTPGPWRLESQRHPEGDSTLILDAKDHPIARTWSPHDDTSRRPQEEAKADARLIAAAPALLAAVSELVAEADDHPGWEGHPHAHSLGFQMARAALAKAEGREP